MKFLLKSSIECVEYHYYEDNDPVTVRELKNTILETRLPKFDVMESFHAEMGLCLYRGDVRLQDEECVEEGDEIFVMYTQYVHI